MSDADAKAGRGVGDAAAARAAVILLAKYLPLAEANLCVAAGEWRPERAVALESLAHAVRMLQDEHRRIADQSDIERIIPAG